MQIINYTPYTIRVFSNSMNIQNFLPSGVVARVSMANKFIGFADSGEIQICKTVYGACENHPENDGNRYIVSTMYYQAAQQQGLDVSHLLVPDSGPSAKRFVDGPQKGHYVLGFIVY